VRQVGLFTKIKLGCTVNKA